MPKKLHEYLPALNERRVSLKLQGKVCVTTTRKETCDVRQRDQVNESATWDDYEL